MTEQNTELTREQRLEIEEQAIQALIDMGVKFSVPLKIVPKEPPFYIKWWNWMFPNHTKIWRDSRLPKSWEVTLTDMPDATMRKVVRTYTRDFYIKPLYLGTIDHLRKLYIQIEYDEQLIQDQPIQESKKLFKYIPVMAEIAAVAVLNSPSSLSPASKEVKTLKAFFMENLTVARMKRLSDVISQMMDPGNFTSSIRSIREMGTTKPKDRADLVE